MAINSGSSALAELKFFAFPPKLQVIVAVSVLKVLQNKNSWHSTKL